MTTTATAMAGCKDPWLTPQQVCDHHVLSIVITHPHAVLQVVQHHYDFDWLAWRMSICRCLCSKASRHGTGGAEEGLIGWQPTGSTAGRQG